jgi:predicted CXXCH cytochrome family protein
MKHAVAPISGLPSPRGLKCRHLVAIVLVLGLSAAMLTWRTSHNRVIRPTVAGSPYMNTRPDVKYVGDAACIRCHADIADTYRRHPMGRSLAPIEASLSTRAFGTDPPERFEARGLEYSIEDKGGHLIHREARRDPDGRIIAENQAEIRYVLGSGKQALGFLIDRDGFLFESPVTFYVHERRWGLSPGYEKRNRHFHRPVLADCLFCHTNRVERAPGAVNRYQSPIFRGHAIGCERCHGPGELHLSRPTVVDGIDRTIVNPADLEPAARDAVCEQCHLIGRRRVVRAGMRSEDYRPGLPFQQFWAVFVTPAGAGDNRFAGQVEQMHESRCFRTSQGQLGCTSCHDPHDRPAPEARAAYFRDRCLECHADRGCRLPEKVRLERGAGDDCTACHMPQLNTSNNAHLATTDHRILRDIAAAANTRPNRAAAEGRLESFVNFHAALMGERDRAAAERDRGVAFCRDGREGAAMALPLLEAALARHPEDVIAWESKAAALQQLGRYEESVAAYSEALSRDPTRESALEGAADVTARTGRQSEAVALWRRAIAVNPWRPHYYSELARAAARLGDWPAVTESCRQALSLQPFDVEVRRRLVQGHLRGGDIAVAQGEFETLLRFQPEERDALVRWYASQLPRR